MQRVAANAVRMMDCAPKWVKPVDENGTVAAQHNAYGRPEMVGETQGDPVEVNEQVVAWEGAVRCCL